MMKNKCLFPWEVKLQGESIFGQNLALRSFMCENITQCAAGRTAFH